MKKQRWLVLLLVLVFVLTSGVLAACTPEKEPDPEPTVEKVTVTFKDEAGAVVKTVELEKGKSLSASDIPTVPAKEGYTGTWSVTAGTAINADTTVTPTYAEIPVDIENVTVSFDTHGGSAMDAVEVAKGSKLTKPADPTYTGYVFDGWYVDAAYLTAYDIETEVTAPLKLHAKWATAKFTVTLPSAYDLAYAGVKIEKLNEKNFATATWTEAETPVATFVGQKDDAEIAYGTKIYIKITQVSAQEGKECFVFANGVQLASKTINTAVPTTGVYEITVKGDVVITAGMFFTATFKVNGGKWADTTTADLVLPIIDGTVTLPVDPSKTGSTFSGWGVGASHTATEKVLANGTLAGASTFHADYTTNKYTVTVVNNVDKVTYELGATEVKYNETVGIKITDGRVTLGGTAAAPTYALSNAAPLLIKANGEQTGTMDASNAGLYQKLFTITITEDTEIAISAEYRVASVKLSNAPTLANAVSSHYRVIAIADTAVTAQDGTVTATPSTVTANDIVATTQVDTDVAAGEKVQWYIWVDQDWTPSIQTGTSYADYSIAPAKATADFGTVEEGDTLKNVYVVTYTMPKVEYATAEKQVDVNNCLAWTEKEYNISGLNVSNDKWMLVQTEGSYAAANGYKLATSNLLTSFKVSNATNNNNYYLGKLAFIVKDTSKVYNVYLGTTLVATTSSVASKYYKDGTTIYDAFAISNDATLADKHADQAFTVKEVSKVTIKIDGAVATTEYVENGKLWSKTGVSNTQEVYVNGIKINGIVGATTTDYQYEVTANTEIKILTKYTITYTGSTGTDAITFSDMTTNALYGDTVSFKVSGTKAGNILYVKATGATAKMLSENEGVYSFTIDSTFAGTAANAYAVTAAFTDEYFTIVYSEGDEAYCPLDQAATFLAQTPKLSGNTFANWFVYKVQAAPNAGKFKPVTSVSGASLTLGELDAAAENAFAAENIVTSQTDDKVLLESGDKVAAKWAKVTPGVQLIIDANTLYEVRSIKVNGSSIYYDGAWKDYKVQMLAGSVTLAYTDVVTVEFRSYMDKDITGADTTKTALVAIGTKTFVADNNGVYTITLADLVDGTSATPAYVIRTQFANAHYAYAANATTSVAAMGVDSNVTIPENFNKTYDATTTTWSATTIESSKTFYLSIGATSGLWQPIANVTPGAVKNTVASADKAAQFYLPVAGAVSEVWIDNATSKVTTATADFSNGMLKVTVESKTADAASTFAVKVLVEGNWYCYIITFTAPAA